MSLSLYLLVDESRVGLFLRWGREQRKVHGVITRSILPNMASSTPDNYLPERYPWCFIISPASRRGKYAYVGAFMLLAAEQEKPSLIVVYSRVSCLWLRENMQSDYPITFWAARILNNVRISDLAVKDWRPLWQWVKALRRAYSPLFNRFLLTPDRRFKHHSEGLLREGSYEDCHISKNDGVEVMPWKNWPNCVEQETGIWIWRQSRYRKIVDSKRIPLRRDEANSSDASF